MPVPAPVRGSERCRLEAGTSTALCFCPALNTLITSLLGGWARWSPREAAFLRIPWMARPGTHDPSRSWGGSGSAGVGSCSQLAPTLWGTKGGAAHLGYSQQGEELGSWIIPPFRLYFFSSLSAFPHLSLSNPSLLQS